MNKQIKPNAIFLYLTNRKEFMKIVYGSGDALEKEDEENGYDSYMYYETYKFNTDDGSLDELDGGILMYKSNEENWDEDINNCIPSLIEYAYSKEVVDNEMIQILS